MPGNVSRGVDEMLMTVKSFGKRSGSYKWLPDTAPTAKEPRLGQRFGSRSKLYCLPDDIPQGYLAVYVGPERKRFVISTKCLSHQLFKALLKRSEEEFGFHHQGGLEIVCDSVLFEHLLWLIGTNNPAATTAQLHELGDVCAFSSVS